MASGLLTVAAAGTFPANSMMQLHATYSQQMSSPSKFFRPRERDEGLAVEVLCALGGTVFRSKEVRDREEMWMPQGSNKRCRVSTQLEQTDYQSATKSAKADRAHQILSTRHNP